MSEQILKSAKKSAQNIIMQLRAALPALSAGKNCKCTVPLTEVDLEALVKTRVIKESEKDDSFVEYIITHQQLAGKLSRLFEDGEMGIKNIPEIVKDADGGVFLSLFIEKAEPVKAKPVEAKPVEAKPAPKEKPTEEAPAKEAPAEGKKPKKLKRIFFAIVGAVIAITVALSCVNGLV